MNREEVVVDGLNVSQHLASRGTFVPHTSKTVISSVTRSSHSVSIPLMMSEVSRRDTLNTTLPKGWSEK